MPHRNFWIGAAGCYVLAYVVILILAATKGLDLTSLYSLLVWLVSAFLLSVLCGTISLLLATVIGRFKIKLNTIVILWAMLTLLAGILLVLNAV